jgi:hypothetical protein
MDALGELAIRRGHLLDLREQIGFAIGLLAAGGLHLLCVLLHRRFLCVGPHGSGLGALGGLCVSHRDLLVEPWSERP